MLFRNFLQRSATAVRTNHHVANRAVAPMAMGAKRFYTVGEDNKTSILVEVEDGPGSLQDILKFFWKHDVNMSRIESRPSKGYNQNYSFYIDFDGKRGDPAVDELMADLKKNSLVLMVLHDKKGEWDEIAIITD
uniref:ACT domain-containing protein n=1 Tax=Globisporangium ultimum (strain ATCC 200006 / CBS 805.95 / DAOM BR144) TaxID=431595 RepID=K3WIJ8_GLOUD